MENKDRGKQMNRTEFRSELERLINRYNKESVSDTPDFILADYIISCLAAYDKAVTRRVEWYRLPIHNES